MRFKGSIVRAVAALILAAFTLPAAAVRAGPPEDFILFETLDFSGMPPAASPPLPAERFPNVPLLLVRSGLVDRDGVIDTAATAAALDQCVLLGCGLCADVEALMDPPYLYYAYLVGWNPSPPTPAAIDASLDAWNNFYDWCQNYLATTHSAAPAVAIGLYPGTITDPNVYTYNREVAWRAAMLRTHQRADGNGVLYSSPLQCDFYTMDFSAETPAQDAGQLQFFADAVDDFRTYGCDNKPMYPLLDCFRRGRSMGKPHTAASINNFVSNLRSAGYEGMILYGGWAASLLQSYTPMTPVTSIPTWAAITNGTMNVRLGGITFTVTINFTGVTSMADVALAIQTAVRAEKNALTYNTATYPVDPGLFSCTWDSGSGELRFSLDPTAGDFTFPPDSAWISSWIYVTSEGSGTSLYPQMTGDMGHSVPVWVTIDDTYPDWAMDSDWLSAYLAQADIKTSTIYANAAAQDDYAGGVVWKAIDSITGVPDPYCAGTTLSNTHSDALKAYFPSNQLPTGAEILCVDLVLRASGRGSAADQVNLGTSTAAWNIASLHHIPTVIDTHRFDVTSLYTLGQLNAGASVSIVANTYGATGGMLIYDIAFEVKYIEPVP